MLFLRVCSNCYYGQTSCEGVDREYKNYPLDKNMTVEELEKFIKSKLAHRNVTFTIEIMEED